jgi:uncharacterized small protein (TIGR04563 family)
MADSRKQSIYLPEDLLAEVRAEAQRQDRSVSWLLQQAWKVARERLKTLPGVPGSDESRPAA